MVISDIIRWECGMWEARESESESGSKSSKSKSVSVCIGLRG